MTGQGREVLRTRWKDSRPRNLNGKFIWMGYPLQWLRRTPSYSPNMNFRYFRCSLRKTCPPHAWRFQRHDGISKMRIVIWKHASVLDTKVWIKEVRVVLNRKTVREGPSCAISCNVKECAWIKRALPGIKNFFHSLSQNCELFNAACSVSK